MLFCQTHRPAAVIQTWAFELGFPSRQATSTDYVKVKRIYNQQLAVVIELKKHIKSRHDSSERSKNVTRSLSEGPRKANITEVDMVEATDLVEKIQNRVAEIDDLQRAVTRTNDQVRVSYYSSNAKTFHCTYDSWSYKHFYRLNSKRLALLKPELRYSERTKASNKVRLSWYSPL